MSNLLAKSIYLPNFSSPNAQNNKFAKVSPTKLLIIQYICMYVGWNKMKDESCYIVYCNVCPW